MTNDAKLTTTLIGLTLVASACAARTVYFKASPVHDQNLSLELVDARARRGAIDILLQARNLTSQEMVYDRNQFAVVGQNGEYFRSGRNAVFVLQPGQTSRIRLVVRASKVAFHRAPGLYVRFDGFYVDGARVNVPVLTLGKPPHTPGTARADFRAPSRKMAHAEPKTFLDAVRDWTTGKRTEQGKQSAGTKATLSRVKLKETGLRCAAMPLKAVEVGQGIAEIMDEVLLGELQDAGFVAIGKDDVNAMLGLEQAKDAVGCDDSACIAEIGAALGVAYLVAGSLGQVEESMVVNLKLIDVRRARVLARSYEMAAGGMSGVPAMLRKAVNAVVTKSGL